MKNFTRGMFALSFLITGVFLLSPIQLNAQTSATMRVVAEFGGAGATLTGAQAPSYLNYDGYTQFGHNTITGEHIVATFDQDLNSAGFRVLYQAPNENGAVGSNNILLTASNIRTEFYSSTGVLLGQQTLSNTYGNGVSMGANYRGNPPQGYLTVSGPIRSAKIYIPKDYKSTIFFSSGIAVGIVDYDALENPGGTPTNPGPISQKFIIGDRVEVATASTSGLNTRASASTSASSLCTQPDGNLGTIMSGPVLANGYNWWQVNYDQGCDGWGAENYLVKAGAGNTGSGGGGYIPISIPLPIILPSPTPTPSSPTKPTNTSSTVNLKANGSDGLLSISLGTAVNLSWVVSGQTSCYKSSTPASEFTGALIPINNGSLPVYPTSSVQYNITCGNYSDSVTINVNGNSFGGGDYVNPYRAFAVGDTVQATVLLNVRSGATLNASVVTSVPAGTTGAILAGPISANGHNWWQVNYTGGQSGWSSGSYLNFVSSSTTSSQTTSTGCASIYGYSSTTGQPCSNYFSTTTTTGGTGSYPPGCASSSGYSSTTGQLCSGQPGDAQSQDGVGTIPPITQISPIPSANGPQQFRLYGGGLLSRYGIAFVNSDNPYRGRATPFDSIDSNGASGLATIDLGGMTGEWSLRITDPVTYATSPWFTINVQ